MVEIPRPLHMSGPRCPSCEKTVESELRPKKGGRSDVSPAVYG